MPTQQFRVPTLVQAFLFCVAWLSCEAQPSIDGGRSELPGMKQDVFDQLGRNRKPGPARTGKGPPDCPKSDGMSAFPGLAFVGSELFVKLNSSEDKCQRLVSIGGANHTVLKNASRTCGPAGEWKKRIAENLSSVFFQGGLDWVQTENQTIEVITENGTFEVEVSEAKYADMLDCWKYGCECEQAKNPIGKTVLMGMLVIALSGLGYDGLKLLWQKFKGEKPPKHVTCKHGHRLEEAISKSLRNHYCDTCGAQGASYQCAKSCNYDLCKKCYKETKRKVKAAYKEWLEKHPEEKEKEKDAKKDDKEDDQDEDEKRAENSDASESKSKADDDSRSAAESTEGKSTAADGDGEDEDAVDNEEPGGEEAKSNE